MIQSTSSGTAQDIWLWLLLSVCFSCGPTEAKRKQVTLLVVVVVLLAVAAVAAVVL